MNQILSIEAIQEIVTDMIIKYGYSEKSVTPEASFTKDLSFDSLDIAELVMYAEQQFEIDLPSDAVEENCQTVASISQLIYQRLNIRTGIEQ